VNTPEGWRVEITRPATRDLRRLDRPMRERILAAIEDLATDPPPGDIKRLSGVTPPQWRLRVGDLRVRFNRDSETWTVLVLRVLPRGRLPRLMRRGHERGQRTEHNCTPSGTTKPLWNMGLRLRATP
jgi:mRNA interferase RelE/StbE